MITRYHKNQYVHICFYAIYKPPYLFQQKWNNRAILSQHPNGPILFGRILYMIAHGANGCIYKPPLRCITKFKLKHKHTISKYNFDKDTFLSELHGQRLMDQADPSFAFHVPAETCSMANTAANKNAANQCLALNSLNRHKNIIP